MRGTYLLTPAQMIRWLAQRARIGRLAAVALMLRLVLRSTLREKVTSLKMQRIIRSMENPRALIQTTHETQPYRNEAEIKRLFDRLHIPILKVRTLATCWIAQV